MENKTEELPVVETVPADKPLPTIELDSVSPSPRENALTLLGAMSMVGVVMGNFCDLISDVGEDVECAKEFKQLADALQKKSVAAGKVLDKVLKKLKLEDVG